VGLLPRKLPTIVTVVLTAPNFSTVRGVGGRVLKTANVIALPPLPIRPVTYCLRDFEKFERRLPALVDRICEKAKGTSALPALSDEYRTHQTTDDSWMIFPVSRVPSKNYYRELG